MTDDINNTTYNNSYDVKTSKEFMVDNSQEMNKKPNELPKKKKKKAASILLTSILTLTVLAVTLPEAIAEGQVSAHIMEAFATESAITYIINVDKGDDLQVVLYNDFTRRVEPLQVGENEGTFTNLKPGMSYTLAVVGDFGLGERKIVTKKITTSLQKEKNNE